MYEELINEKYFLHSAGKMIQNKVNANYVNCYKAKGLTTLDNAGNTNFA